MSGVFMTEVPGKWVLAGEHTVLRGGSAIALPHSEFRLRLEFRPGEGELGIEPELLKIAKDWLAKRGTEMRLPRGTVGITSTIPRGAGLGSSAALSVAVARWILASHALAAALETELARELENHFHGTSSGMDVAVVSLGKPIWFSMKDGAAPLGVRRLPKFVFFDTGLRAPTRECVARVASFRATDPARGAALDAEMGIAIREILRGLQAADETAGLTDVARGMKRAGDVFGAWGLVPDSVRALIAKLESEGVRSPRLTGAGGGGFIVGLDTAG